MHTSGGGSTELADDAAVPCQLKDYKNITNLCRYGSPGSGLSDYWLGWNAALPKLAVGVSVRETGCKGSSAELHGIQDAQADCNDDL
jgi:hypothetical protein